VEAPLKTIVKVTVPSKLLCALTSRMVSALKLALKTGDARVKFRPLAVFDKMNICDGTKVPIWVEVVVVEMGTGEIVADPLVPAPFVVSAEDTIGAFDICRGVVARWEFCIRFRRRDDDPLNILGLIDLMLYGILEECGTGCLNFMIGGLIYWVGIGWMN
jgi:hypothetical protein